MAGGRRPAGLRRLQLHEASSGRSSSWHTATPSQQSAFSPRKAFVQSGLSASFSKLLELRATWDLRGCYGFQVAAWSPGPRGWERSWPVPQRRAAKPAARLLERCPKVQAWADEDEFHI